jgi:hypothetical protein
LIDYDNDGSSDQLLISDSFGPEEEKTYEISQAVEVPDFIKNDLCRDIY